MLVWFFSEKSGTLIYPSKTGKMVKRSVVLATFITNEKRN